MNMLPLRKELRMNLKNKIVELLEKQSYSYKDLAEHVNLTEEQLDHALETKTLEVRTLELISKELRIPLYSFFRDPAQMAAYLEEKEKYYDVNIWSDQEVKYRSEITELREHLKKLSSEVKNKELLIEALETQVKKNWTDK
jgi:transcriptional regulator with XRE-family HTH domain